MIKTLLFSTVLTYSIHAHAQSINSAYNKPLADSLGADDHGMKKYVLVILKTGAVTIADKKLLDSLQTGHFQNIVHLAQMGKLVLSGPLQKNEKTYEGIFILNVKTFADAKLLLQTDPAISARLLDFELYQWYGSAALPLYLKDHDQVKKMDF